MSISTAFQTSLMQNQQQSLSFGGFGGGTSGFGVTLPTTSSLGGFGCSSLSGNPLTSGSRTSGLSKGPRPESLFQFIQTSALSPTCIERLKIEMFLNLGFEFLDSRAQIVEKIRSLAKGGGLASYNWNAPSASWATSSSSTIGSLISFFSGDGSSGVRSGDAINTSTTRNVGSSDKEHEALASSYIVKRLPSDAELVMHLVCRVKWLFE